MQSIRRWIPAGHGLSDEAWRGRHRAIVALAWAHAVGVPIYGLVQGRTIGHVLLEGAPIAIFALLACIPSMTRRWRAAAASAALMTSSAILVHFSNGLIEMHFHFFVMVPIIALYQDWIPFLIAIGYVLVHHTVMGELAPASVYNHQWGQDHPFKWALVHAGFIAAASVVSLATWRMNELMLARQRRAEDDLIDEKRIVETLHSVGTSVVAELEIDRVAQLVTDAGVEATGAKFGAFFYNVHDPSGDAYVLYTLSGAPRSAFASFPMPRATNVFEPTFSGTKVVRADDILADERYGKNDPFFGMPEGHLPVRSYLAVPVRSRGSSEVLGGLFFGHPEVGVFTETAERLAVGIATQAAVAFDNARLYEAEREAHAAAEGSRARLSLLSEAARLLVASLDPAETLVAVANLIVPTLADLCIVDVLEEDDTIKRVAVTAIGDLSSLAAKISDLAPDRNNEMHPSVRVINGLGPEFQPEIKPEMIDRGTRSPEHASIVKQMQETSSITVPLTGRDSVLGGITFVTVASSERSFVQDDVALAEELGRRAGLAVENARLYQAERAAHVAAEAARSRLTLLAESGRLIASSLEQDVTLRNLARLTVPVLADACLIDVVQEDGTITRVVAAAEGIEPFAENLRRFPPDPNNKKHPVYRVLRGETVLFEEVDDAFFNVIASNEEHRTAAEGIQPRSVIIVPLTGRGRTHGALSLIKVRSSGRTFTREDIPLTEEIGRRTGLAVDNARLYQAERDALASAETAQGRLALLAEASRILASSLDVDTTLRNIANLTVPRIGDLCAIDMVDDSGQIRRVATEGAPGLESVAAEVAKHPPTRATRDHPVIRVLETGASQLELMDRVSIDGYSKNDHTVGSSRDTSAISVPLLGRERVLGTITIATTVSSGRMFTADDLPLVEELGRRAGIAIENARLYNQQRSVAESLQHALLPQHLPSIPGFQATARYLPGSPGERVGGDWYDLFEIPTGEIAVVMGDVVGHGIPAASLMAQLRNAMRAYVWDGLAPNDVLSRLNQFLCGLERDGMATVCVGLLDPISSKLRFSNAGHPPILHIRGDEATFVGEALGPPLGAVPYARYQELTLELRPHDTAVFYTDGLVEDRATSLDAGLERMRVAAMDGTGNIEDQCNRIVSSCLSDRVVEDDVAVLVLRSLPLGSTLTLRLPAEPRVLSSLRQTLRRWLHENGVNEAETQEILIALGEACNNAIEHGSTAANGWFEIEAGIDDDLKVVVHSAGEWRSGRDDGGGRGLPVMKELMDDVQVDDANGITVTLRRKLNRARVDA